jgi:hypothetical protein
MLIQSSDVHLTAAAAGLCLCILHVYKEESADFFIVPPDSGVFCLMGVRLVNIISSLTDIGYTYTWYFRRWRLSKRFHCKKSGFVAKSV